MKRLSSASIAPESVTFDALRAFAVFAETANLTRAAEELHLSQPALYAKVQKLATGLGTALYVRDGRRLEITPAGRAVAELALRLDAELELFLTELGAPAPGPVVIAAGAGAHRYVLAAGIRALVGRGQRLRLLSADREATLEAVRSGRATLGVTVLGRLPKGLHAIALAEYPQVVNVPADHRLARRRSVRLGELHGEDLVLAPLGRPQRTALEDALRLAGVTVSVVAEAEGWPQLLHFVALGVGIGVANGCVEPEPGTVSRPIEDLPPVTYSAVVRSTARTDPALGQVIDALRGGAP